jgi:hypothetical protein
VERFEISRLLYTDPTALQKLPLSEYLKRKAYWLEVRKLTQKVQEGPGGVVIEHTGAEIENDAVIIE